MARKPRIHFPGALYHVITRGNRRQGVFLDEKDLEQFLTYLSDCKSRFPFRLYTVFPLPDPTFKSRLIANRRFIETWRKKMRGGDAKDTGILTVGRRVKFIK